MKCNKQEISEKLVLYVEKLLPPEEMEEVRLHLGECSSCHDEEGALRSTMALLSGAAEKMPPCPDEELLVTYSEDPGSLPEKDRTRIEGHLKACRFCTDALSLLHELENEPHASHATIAPSMPDALRKEAQRLYGKPESPGFLHRLAQLFQAGPRYALISGLAAVLLIIGTMTFIFNDLSRSSLPGEVPSEKAMSRQKPGTEATDMPPSNSRIPMQEGQTVASAPPRITSNVVPGPASVERTRLNCGEKGLEKLKSEEASISRDENEESHGTHTAGNSIYKHDSVRGQAKPAAPAPPSSGGNMEPSKKAPAKEKEHSAGYDIKAFQAETKAQEKRETQALGMDPTQSHTSASTVQRAQWDSEIRKQEREMALKALASVNSAIGKDRASISISLTADDRKDSFLVDKIYVQVNCISPLTAEEHRKVKTILIRTLKLDTKKDSIIIMESLPAR